MDKATSFHLDELVCHLRSNVQAFRVALSGLFQPSLRFQGLRFGEMIRSGPDRGVSAEQGHDEECKLAHFALDTSVPFFAGSGPPSKTMYGVMPKWRSSRTRCMA